MEGQSIKTGFKTQKNTLERSIRKAKKEFEVLSKKEKRARESWTKEYRAFLAAAEKLSETKIHGTQKEKSLKLKIKSWRTQTDSLTRIRDSFRAQKDRVNLEITSLSAALAMLTEQESSEIKITDEIVTQVFSLNEAVVHAATDRIKCLNRHVFPRLIDENNKLRSQVSFTSADGLQRVVAMVNSMTIIKGEQATEAKTEIEKFFKRFHLSTTIDETLKPLYDLTRELLIEKIDFKIGQDFYRFISMELDAQVFPELAHAQTLLRQSIRSEKTNSYIRLYRRARISEKWEVVPQS